jgi:hypothetical protein
VAVLVLGMSLVPLRVTGVQLTYLPSDALDGLFNSCVLEHGWQWLIGQQPRFWDAPFYYPEPRVIAYSDNHLGTLPLYAAFRLVGLDRETAYQGWFLTLFVLNYVVCAWVLRRMGMGWAGVAAGAYLFTFGMPMVEKIGHVQLIARFMVPLAVLFCVNFCRDGRARDLLGLGVCVVMQFYISIYMGYFLSLYLVAFLPILLLLNWRSEVIAQIERVGWEPLIISGLLVGWAYATLPLHRHRVAFLLLAGLLYSIWRYREGVWQSICGGTWQVFLVRAGCALGCAAALIPLLWPYIEFTRERGGRPSEEVLGMLPRLASWISPPQPSLLWGRWHSNCDHLGNPGENVLFPGLIPSFMLLIALGAVFARRPRESSRVAAAAALAVVVLFVLTITIHGHSLYSRLVVLPGVSAIRAVTRIILLLLFPMGIVVAWGISALQASLARRWGRVPALAAACLFVTVAVVDQLTVKGPGWPKEECQQRIRDLAAEVLQRDPSAGMFLDVRANHSDNIFDQIRQNTMAMAVAQFLGIPTLNGYSGWSPEEWPLFKSQEQVHWWEAKIVDRVGDAQLCKRVPWYAQHRFDHLVVLGDLTPAPDLPCTHADGPLAADGLRARVELPPDFPTTIAAGKMLTTEIRVTNASGATWHAFGKKDGAFRIGSGYRWLLPSGREALSGPRQYLWHDVAPSASAQLELNVEAPKEPGRYILEIDLIQEQVGWFTDKGSTPLRLQVEIVSKTE